MIMLRHVTNTILVLLALQIGMPVTVNANQDDTLVFGIVPQQAGSKLSRKWTPILQYLEEESGLKLRFATTRNIPTFEKRLQQGKYDVAYMNPYHYTQYHDISGYEAFAKAKGKRLKGILIVHKDSPYKSINELENQKLAFPSNAFAASLVMRARFNGLGIPIEAHDVASHDSVYRNVAKNRYAAGGGVMRTYKNTSAAYRDNLRILWKSDGYTPHAFASHPRVSSAKIKKLQLALVKMNQDPRGKQLLKSIRLKGIESGQNEEWNDVRKLELD